MTDPAAVALLVDQSDPSKLPDSEAVLNALRAVKVCDPACGSGAYLLGMMQELLRLREALFATKGLDAVTVYRRKLEIIQNNLYGVDLDVFAVNIAKLRLWLSLAIDFEGKVPPPLANLEFKIECGDSLTAPNPQELSDLYRHAVIAQADKLADLKGKFIGAHGAEKKKLVRQIKELEAKLDEQMPDHSPPGALDWRIAFAEVFKNGGFDVVLGNPPYVRQEEIKALKPALKKVYECYSGVADLFVYFYERGIKLLKPGGQFAFITSNKWYRSGYGEKLRTWLAARTRLHGLIDFGDAPVFEAIAYLRSFSDYMKLIPIPAAAPAEQTALEKLVRRIVKARGESADVTALEAEVNVRVYRLFGMTREEIVLVEESGNQSRRV